MKLIFLVLIAAAAGTPATPGDAAKLTAQAEQLFLELRYTEAEPVFRLAVDLWSAMGPREKRNRALAMSNLGSLLRALERYPESERLLTESLRDLAPGLDASRALWNLATLYRVLGDLPKAESCARQAAVMVEGPDRAVPRLVLAAIYIDQHRFMEAEEILTWAQEGADDALRVAIDNSYAAIALTTGNYSRAEEYSRKAIEAAKRSLPAQHPAVAAAWNHLGQARWFQGDYLEAERAYRESMECWKRTVGPAHPSVARVMINLAALYHERGREAGAESLYRNAAAILETALGPDHYLTLMARNELADVLRAERRFTEADKLSAATLAGLDRTLPAGDVRRLRALMNRWRLLQDTGRVRDAADIAARLTTETPASGDHSTGGQVAVPK